MKGESCRAYASGLVEYARTGELPTGDLDRHLDSCAACRERWDAETQVTAGLGTVRLLTADRSASAESRERVMRAFERERPALIGRERRQTAFPFPRSHSLGWGLAAAAMLLITAGVLVPRLSRSRERAAVASAAVASSAVSADAISTDARGLTSDEFVAVPYAPPLASGELVRIVHADLDPEALATLGFTPDPAWTEDLPADVVVGEDGYPRAVRISDNSQF